MSFVRSRIFLLLALCGLVLQGAAGAQDGPSGDSPTPGTFQIGDLVLTAPEGWYAGEVTQSPSGEEIEGVLASGEEGSQAVVVVNIVPKRGRSLEALNSVTRNFVVMRMDGVVEYERDKRINGYPAKVLVYEGRSGSSGQGRRKFMRTVIEKDGYFYIIQGVADAATFAKQAGTLEGLTNSALWTE